MIKFVLREVSPLTLTWLRFHWYRHRVQRLPAESDTSGAFTGWSRAAACRFDESCPAGAHASRRRRLPRVPWPHRSTPGHEDRSACSRRPGTGRAPLRNGRSSACRHPSRRRPGGPLRPRRERATSRRREDESEARTRAARPAPSSASSARWEREGRSSALPAASLHRAPVAHRGRSPASTPPRRRSRRSRRRTGRRRQPR